MYHGGTRYHDDTFLTPVVHSSSFDNRVASNRASKPLGVDHNDVKHTTYAKHLGKGIMGA